MLRLHTFGGLYVLDDAGSPVDPATTTRRTLALLAGLAVAGEAGLSRDKLVALFWPETDAERARHSLTQALYSARRSFQCDDLFLGGADVRLNPERIGSDVGELEASLASGELERGVTRYRGPFLDGFFLSGSPEFEQWTSAQRTRFETRVAESLEHLAMDAGARDDHRRAVEWWRRLSALRPLDSSVAVALIKSLSAAGDRPGAIQHASAHEAVLREQLGLAPDAAVTNLARALREEGAAAVGAVGVTDRIAPSAYRQARVAGPSGRSGPSGADEESLRPPGPESRPGATGATGATSPSRGRRARLWFFAAAGGAALAAAVVFGGRDETPTIDGPARHSQRVVVAPFRIAGASPELHYLREGIVELLSSRLADDSLRQSVDAGAVLSAWRSDGLMGETGASREAILNAAARLGWERVVVGSIVGSRSRMIVDAAVLSAPRGAVVAEATVEGPADSVSKVIDRLASALLLAQAGEDSRVLGRLTESLPALRAYLEGQAAFQRRAYRAAMGAYDRALRHDSTFARAALRLAWTADRIREPEAIHRGVALAWAARANLSERDQALLWTFTGAHYPAPSSAEEQLLSWRRAVDVAPRTANAWVALGARLVHEGAVVGLPWSGAAERARSSLERARALDPSSSIPAELTMQLAHHEGAALAGPSPDGALRARALGDSLSPIAPFLRWREAVIVADTSTLRRMREQFGQLRVSTLRLIAMSSQYSGSATADGDRAIEILLERATDEPSQADALEALHSQLINHGRYEEALAVTGRLRRLQPGLHAHLRLRVLDAMYGGGDTTAARAAVQELGRFIEPAGVAGLAGVPLTTASWLASRCVLAQWRLRSNDTTGVRETIDDLRSQRVSSQRPRITAAPVACAELLDAALAVVQRRGDAAARLERIDNLAFIATTAGDAATYAPLLIAGLHERLGDSAGALRALRKRSYMSAWPRYLGAMRRAEEGLIRASGPIETPLTPR